MPEVFSHYDMRFVKPLDDQLLHTIFKTYTEIITLEEGVIAGGFGSAIAEFAALNNYVLPLKILGVPDYFIDHASVKQQHHSIGIDVDSLMLLFNTTALRLK
jgi:1-deoxy-D-xylulose-5-phosphate synthase